jgi:hypothetical protein
VTPFQKNHARSLFPKDKWVLYFILVITVIILLSLSLQTMNGDLKGGHQRFPILP